MTRRLPVRYAGSRLNRSGDPSGTQSEHLFQCLQEATRDKEPDTTYWLKVDDIVQEKLHNGILSDKSTWQTLVLIPEEDGEELQGIRLVQVFWNTVIGILNRCFTSTT